MHKSQAFSLLTGRGRVFVSRKNGRTILSFALDDASSVDEILQRIAPSIFTFPAEGDVIDSEGHIQTSVQLGKVFAGSKYAVYYIGAATQAEAASLGNELLKAGYWENGSFPVVLSKTGTTSIGFVLEANPVYMLQYFERLVRIVAPKVGGPPIEMRIINTEMMTKRRIVVR